VRGGDRVKVLTPSGPQVAERWRDQGVEIASFRYAPRRFETVGYSRTLRADEHVRASSGMIAPLYLLAARRAVERELAAGSWDLVQAHWIVPNALAAAPLARRIPLAVGLHGSDVFLAEKPFMRPLVARALRRTRVLTACSPELARRVEALGFDRAHSHVIPYGVDTELFRPDPQRGGAWRQRLGVPGGAVLALGVGRMATKKGFHVLMAALPEIFARAPELHIVLAGGGDRLEELRRAAAPWSERVHFPGPVLHDTLPDLYRAADLFVLPAVHDSKGNVDGLPNVILEAMASGLPIVASGISGIPIAVETGINGRLVGEGDAAGLATAVAELALAAELRNEMGQRSRRRAETELTWDAVARRYREAYLDALSRD
jgi:glycosyltransferase involved in cell wall biosynthesis